MTSLVYLEGASELDKVLQMLPEEIARKDVNAALYAGAAIVAAAMKSSCPVGAESHIYRATSAKGWQSVFSKKKSRMVHRSARSGKTGVEIERQPGYGKKQIRPRLARPSEFKKIAEIVGDSNISAAAVAGVGSKAFYLKFIEWGWILTSHGKSRSGRRRIKHIPPRPFLRPAWEMSKMSALNIIGQTLGRAIEKSAERLSGAYRSSGFSSRGRTFIGR